MDRNLREHAEELRRVLERRVEPLADLHHLERHWIRQVSGNRFVAEILAGRHERPPAQLRVREVELAPVEVLQEKQGLEKRRRSRVAPLRKGPDDQIERRALMRVSPERHFADPAEHLPERRIARQADAQRQRVHETADQVLDLTKTTIRERRADDDVVLTAVAGQQNRERREQRHEQRGVLALAERLEPLLQLAGDPHVPVKAVRCVRGTRRALAVKLQHRCARHLALPVLQCRAGFLALHPLVFPRREVAVLHRQFGQRRRFAFGERTKQRGQLANQDVLRPAVRHDVVQEDEHHVVIRRQVPDPRADQRSGFERPGRELRAVDALREAAGALAVGDAAQVLYCRLDLQNRPHRLDRLAVGDRKRGAQHLVPPDHLVQRLVEDGDIQGAGEAGHFLDRERLIQRGHPIEKPEALLGEGKGKVGAVRPAARDRRGRGSAGPAGQALGQQTALLVGQSRNPLFQVRGQIE